uniref:Calpain catalytic domain-containing protein n=1 Tax=Branchiostoma floridae TaxID=7739 RepID=C3ZZL6_BRAFL|eukprot:XP_002586006.1 hypothetical protein BRAFLDRAFT_132644 [Branchiostoma floridae]
MTSEMYTSILSSTSRCLGSDKHGKLALSPKQKTRFARWVSIIYPQNKRGEPQYNPCGKYMVKLNINGVHRKVIIDDFLPMDQYGELLCSFSNNRNELWVSLLEKAYMKVMGGYDFPGSNSNIDLHALTGWIPERVPIRQGSDDFNKNGVFNMMRSRFHKGECLITVATGVFWIDYDSLCHFFDVIYINWNPEMFRFTTCMHDVWLAKEGPKKDLYSLGDNPQYRLEVKGPKGGAAVWVLLTRHITDKDDFAVNKEYITNLVYKTGGRKVFYPNDPRPYIDGVRINSPHYLCKISVKDPGISLYTLVISQYEKSNNIYYTLRIYSTCEFNLTKVPEPYKIEKTVSGQWKGSSAGGCGNNPATYPNNPVFQFTLQNSANNNHVLLELKGPKQYSVGFDVKTVTLTGDGDSPGAFQKAASGDFRCTICSHFRGCFPQRRRDKASGTVWADKVLRGAWMKLLDYSRFKRGKRAAPGRGGTKLLQIRAYLTTPLLCDKLKKGVFRYPSFGLDTVPGTVSQTDEPLQASGVAQVNKNLHKNSFSPYTCLKTTVTSSKAPHDGLPLPVYGGPKKMAYGQDIKWDAAYTPSSTKYCHTLHRMNGEGGSVMVRKKCAAVEDCTPNTVGCSINTDGSMVCIACCEGNICNPEVPTNHTTAIFATITPYDVGSSSHFNPSVQVLLVTLLAAVLFRHL